MIKSLQWRLFLFNLSVAGLLTWINWRLVAGTDWYGPWGKILRWPIGFLICPHLNGHSLSSEKTACLYWFLITAFVKFSVLLILLTYLFRSAHRHRTINSHSR